MKDIRIQSNFDHLRALIEDLAKLVRAGFERTDLRFERVDTRFDQVDARIDHLRDTSAEHFEVLETRLNERLDRLEQRV